MGHSGKQRLNDLLAQSDNRVCADCSAPNPKWASVNIGVFICLKCCGVHRSLGTQVSKVLSVTLDEWSDDEIDAVIEVGGNRCANSIYEAYIPDGVSKPGPDADHEQRSKFIRSKYELQEFLKPSLRILSSNKSSSQESSKKEGMEDSIGTLKVKVIKGKNLVVRDMRTSDPYVVLTLGQQKAKTAVVQSNLNPVWNEELTLFIPQNFGPIQLQVYDHDLLSADDGMGTAEIDIQPMLTSASAYGNPEMYGDMQIGKWLKSDDNALLEDSIVNIVDGKVTQTVSLKLQNVQSGEVELELEWVPLEQ